MTLFDTKAHQVFPQVGSTLFYPCNDVIYEINVDDQLYSQILLSPKATPSDYLNSDIVYNNDILWFVRQKGTLTAIK